MLLVTFYYYWLLALPPLVLLMTFYYYWLLALPLLGPPRDFCGSRPLALSLIVLLLTFYGSRIILLLGFAMGCVAFESPWRAYRDASAGVPFHLGGTPPAETWGYRPSGRLIHSDKPKLPIKANCATMTLPLLIDGALRATSLQTRATRTTAISLRGLIHNHRILALPSTSQLLAPPLLVLPLLVPPHPRYR